MGILNTLFSWLDGIGMSGVKAVARSDGGGASGHAVLVVLPCWRCGVDVAGHAEVVSTRRFPLLSSAAVARSPAVCS